MSNDVPVDHNRSARPYTSPPGAYTGPVSGPIAADFTALPLSGSAPLTVTFSDKSTGPVTGWSWTFGDGGVSTGRSPTYAYTTPGLYTVSLTASGTGTPDTETKNNYIRVTAGSGALKVTISPQAAIDQGARWNVDGGKWRTSGTTVSGLSGGSHTVAFKDVSGWTTPASKTVTLSAGATKSVSGAYVLETGSLKVTLKPSAAVRAGAKWKLDSGAWRAGGTTVSKIPVGKHTVTCKPVTGWTTPAKSAVTVSMGKKNRGDADLHKIKERSRVR